MFKFYRPGANSICRQSQECHSCCHGCALWIVD